MIYMRSIFFSVLLLFVLVSCNDDDEDVQFSLDYPVEFDIPATFGVELAISTEDFIVETESADQFTTNNTSADLINEAKITTLQIALNSPAGEDFSFIDDLTLFMKASGQDEVAIGTLNDVSGDGVLLNLDIKNLDLKDYLSQTSLTFRMEFTSDDYTGVDRNCALLCVFSVDATQI